MIRWEVMTMFVQMQHIDGEITMVGKFIILLTIGTTLTGVGLLGRLLILVLLVEMNLGL